MPELKNNQPARHGILVHTYLQFRGFVNLKKRRNQHTIGRMIGARSQLRTSFRHSTRQAFATAHDTKTNTSNKCRHLSARDEREAEFSILFPIEKPWAALQQRGTENLSIAINTVLVIDEEVLRGHGRMESAATDRKQNYGRSEIPDGNAPLPWWDPKAKQIIKGTHQCWPRMSSKQLHGTWARRTAAAEVYIAADIKRGRTQASRSDTHITVQ